MRLYELTGYKNSELYKTAKEIQYGDEMADASYNEQSMEKFVNQIKKDGWSVLGTGYFSHVFEHPAKPYVVKLFTNSPNYMDYLKFVIANQNNPFVPKLRGKIIRIDDSTNAIRMEKLAKLTGEEDPILARYIDPRLGKSTGWLIDGDNRPFLEQHYPQLADVLEVIDILSLRIGDVDLNDGSILKRGVVPVITDLILG